MKKYSILSLELNDDVSTEERNLFYKALEKFQWKRINSTTTLWYAHWKSDASDEGIVNTTKNDVEQAAKTSNVKHYDASTAICGQPVVWKK